MSDEHRKIFRKYYHQLHRCMCCIPLVPMLQQRLVLSSMEAEKIQGKQCPVDKRELLLKLIIRKPDSAFDQFLYSLGHSKQGHLTHLLNPSGKCSTKQHFENFIMRPRVHVLSLITAPTDI